MYTKESSRNVTSTVPSIWKGVYCKDKSEYKSEKILAIIEIKKLTFPRTPSPSRKIKDYSRKTGVHENKSVDFQ